MGRDCPIYGKAIYLDCLECDDKSCRNAGKKSTKQEAKMPEKYPKYNTVCIGIDQSYKRTGISISCDGVLKIVKSVDLTKFRTNSERREYLHRQLVNVLFATIFKCVHLVVIIERIRLQSKGYINMDYIKSIGALNSIIVDVFSGYDDTIIYSVDTRAWKSRTIGTSKPMANKYGVPEEKWPTVKWVIDKGFEAKILKPVKGKKKKGTFIRDGIRYEYDNDAADSAGISMFYWTGNKELLKEEK